MQSPVLISPLLLGLFLASCQKPEAEAPAAPPPTVEYVNPVQEEITSWDYYNGRLEPVESVELRARVSGLLEEIHFEAGEQVEKGDLLFTLDKSPFLAAYRAAEAELEQAKAAQELAKSNHVRGQQLLQRNAIAKEEVDVREGTLAEAEASVQAAQAQLEIIALDLNYTDVRSPISGRIADHFVTVGNLISGGTAESTLLTTIVSVDPIYARIDADESSVLKYFRLEQEGKRISARNTAIPVEMALDGDDGFPRKGQIDFVNNSFDPNTATLRARAVFSNADGFLTPGMFGKIRLPGRGQYNATLIPEVAIQTQQNLTTISILDAEDTVQSQVVTLGPAHGQMRVIESDLPAETRVIVSGLTRARPGKKATPKPAEKPEAKTAQTEQ